MNERDQLALVKDFMLQIAPEVVRHQMTHIRHRYPLDFEDEEKLDRLHTSTAGICASLTLELAMHLAGQYASAHDNLTSEAYTPAAQEPPETIEPTDAPGKQTPRPPIARIPLRGQDIPS